jgi:hypothetical protein
MSSAGEREGDRTYDQLIDRLVTTHPRLAKQLAAAQRTRTVRIALMSDGVRFRGLEALLSKLDQIAFAWERDSQLEPIAFLVRRAVADFETFRRSRLKWLLRRRVRLHARHHGDGVTAPGFLC